MKQRQRGYLLVEMLTALTLFSLAGTSLYTGYLQGLRCYREIGENYRIYAGPKMSFMKMEEDLRNMTALREYPFKGSEEEILFPAFLPVSDDEGRTEYRLYQVRYFVRRGELVREQQELTSALKKPKASVKVMMKKVDVFKFSFPFESEDGRPFYGPIWPEDPYAGLPRMVRVELSSGELRLNKTVSVPHGAWAASLGAAA